MFGSSSEEEIDEKLDQILSENSERMKQFTRQRTLNQYRTRSEEEKVDERESNYQVRFVYLVGQRAPEVIIASQTILESSIEYKS